MLNTQDLKKHYCEKTTHRNNCFEYFIKLTCMIMEINIIREIHHIRYVN